MKKNYVDGLVTGSDFDDFFLLKSMAVRVGSNQKKYIDMILSDKTGDVSAKKWDASDTEIAELESYGENAIIKIRAVSYTHLDVYKRQVYVGALSLSTDRM